MLKALAGGGGRGMRAGDASARTSPRPSSAARPRPRRRSATARSTSSSCFPRARHIEVQIIGDGTGAVVHLWDRECSLQRQRQKLVEIAPAVGVDEAVRDGAVRPRR